jgi:hypothetical protein
MTFGTPPLTAERREARRRERTRAVTKFLGPGFRRAFIEDALGTFGTDAIAEAIVTRLEAGDSRASNFSRRWFGA